MAERDPHPNASWARYRNHLRRYLRARVDPVDAEDITGEILLRLVARTARAQPGLDGPVENPAAWLSRVASNALTDHFRRRAVEARAVDAFRTESGLQFSGEQDERGETEPNLADCVLPLIETLPAIYRDALRLTEIEGLSQARAAAQLDLGLSGMKARVQRGRRLLRRALLACCRVVQDRRGGIIEWHPRVRSDGKVPGSRGSDGNPCARGCAIACAD